MDPWDQKDEGINANVADNLPFSRITSLFGHARWHTCINTQSHLQSSVCYVVQTPKAYVMKFYSHVIHVKRIGLRLLLLFEMETTLYVGRV